MVCLLDTCILIDYLRGHDGAARFLEELAEPPAISSITIMELVAGARGHREEEELLRLFSVLAIKDVDQTIAETAGAYLNRYRKSHAIDPQDAIIAATADFLGIELATLNLKHFPMFVKLERPYPP